MFEGTWLTVGQQSMNCAGGDSDCKFFNLNFCAQYNICNKAYIGKTLQQLGRCISQHRGQIQTLSASTSINRYSISIDDNNTLAAHAIEHNVRTKAGFNSFSKFFILKYEEKEKLTISEQLFINKFRRTYRPYVYGLTIVRFYKRDNFQENLSCPFCKLCLKLEFKFQFSQF